MQNSFHSFVSEMEDLSITEDKIIIGARQLLMQYGIKSITMDDIARHLGMSKKTIYQHFEDKESIIQKIMHQLQAKNSVQIHEIIKKAKDPIQESLNIMSLMIQTFGNINPTFYYDLQRYHPTCWGQMHEFKHKFILETVKNSLERGRKLGYFRDDFNIDIIAHLRLTQIPSWMDNNTLMSNQFTMADVVENTTLHFLYGVATPKGHKLINKYRGKTDKCLINFCF